MKRWLRHPVMSIMLIWALSACGRDSEITIPTRFPSATAPAPSVTPSPTDTPPPAEQNAPTPTLSPATASPLSAIETPTPPQTGLSLPPANPTLNPPPLTAPVPDTVVITFRPEASAEERAAFLENLGGVQQTITGLDSVVVSLPAGAENALLSAPIVAASEPDYFVSALQVSPPNDPYYPQQWGLAAMQIPPAWATLPPDAPSVTVAVIDSGVCLEASELSGRLLPGYDFIEDDSAPQDAYGHGCAIASLIAATRDNGQGIAGIAPNARILPVRVLDASGMGHYSDVAAGIVYAVDNGAQVINLSIGGSNPSTLLENAITYATSRGVWVIAAAGNVGQAELLYPARYAGVVSVGALDPDLTRSPFSNHAPDMDAYAPGRDLPALHVSGEVAWFSGTSFAAAGVSGLAALEIGRGRALHLHGGLVTATGSELVSQPPTPTPLPAQPPAPDTLPDTTLMQPLAVIGPSDDRTVITNTAFAPYSAVARVTFRINGQTAHCSGSLIHPRYVLTAAHCIYSDGVYSGSIGDVRVQLGLHNGASLSVYNVSEWFVPPGWIADEGTPAADDDDYGLLRLDRDATGTFSTLPIQALPDGALRAYSVSTVGYPGDKCALWQNNALTYATCPASGGNVAYYAENQWVQTNATIESVTPGTFTTTLDTFGGQSGAPILMRWYGQDVIVGVVSSSPVSPNCPAYQQQTFGYLCTPEHRNTATRTGAAVIASLAAWGVPGYSLPTEITVSAGDTAGFIAAIETLNPGGGIITLQGGEYLFESVHNTTYDASALPVLTGRITVQASAPATLRRAANAPPMRLLAVSPGADVTLNGLTFAGGWLESGNGGALYNAGKLVIERSRFEGNSAGGEGGAIYTTTETLLISAETSFLSNQAGRGGAIRSISSTAIQVVGASFEGNTATAPANGDGGAISGAAQVSQSQFIGNSASGRGGALAGVSLVAFSTFDGNQAGTHGGAIYAEAVNLNVLDSAFNGNQAQHGGAIYVTNGLTLLRSHLEGNQALNAGGDARGGAVYQTALSELRENTFIDNRASAPAGAAYGGALYAVDQSGSVQAAPHIRDTHFLHNRVEGQTAEGSALYYVNRISNRSLWEGNCFAGNNATAVATITNPADTSVKTLTMNDNWWGAPDGPSGVGSGTGDVITSRIIVGVGRFQTTPGNCPPNNDRPSHATPLTLARTYPQNTTTATTQADEPRPACLTTNAPAIWYRYAAGASATLTLTLQAPNQDAILSLWEVNGETRTPIACMDGTPINGLTALEFNAVAGANYLIGVARRDGGGAVSLLLTENSAAPPSLTSPADNTTLTLGARLPAFNWGDVAGALSYELQLWHESTPNPTRALYGNIAPGERPFTPPSTPQAVEYRWRVRARLPGNLYTAWSETRTFRYTSPSTGLVLLNRYSTRQPTLTWSAVSWAVGYEFELYTAPNLNAGSLVIRETGTATAFTPAAALSAMPYYWRVRAIRADGSAGAWSLTQSFVIDVP